MSITLFLQWSNVMNLNAAFLKRIVEALGLLGTRKFDAVFISTFNVIGPFYSLVGILENRYFSGGMLIHCSTWSFMRSRNSFDTLLPRKAWPEGFCSGKSTGLWPWKGNNAFLSEGLSWQFGDWWSFLCYKFHSSWGWVRISGLPSAHPASSENRLADVRLPLPHERGQYLKPCLCFLLPQWLSVLPCPAEMDDPKRN